MKNALTIDLEDYYQVSAFSKNFAVDRWDNYPSRVEHNTAKLLSILDEGNARATFFTLGWVARKYPKLIRRLQTITMKSRVTVMSTALSMPWAPKNFARTPLRPKNY